MHSKNIMHRDIKPENVMLLKKGDFSNLKIVDFGLASYCDVDKFLFPKCGTPGYVAPEIANLTDKTTTYNKVCDIFSAGVIFYKMYIF
jgi:calcium-dependent protein kinase